ncbi:hypothetical protein [Kordiimonas aestuarii]|uniref:hypothetical protein n=1 Tax=Kordiimonas aestuarii TaxID=1005925 RepID=UPI0021D080BE|nr:hypothetical protein [Kordiimonas aestuarii]
MKQYMSKAALAAGALMVFASAPWAEANAYGGSSCPTEDISNWFPHSQTPEPDNAGFDSSTICNFHEWSWQMFLWLTQDVDGEPRFLSFASPYELLGLETRGIMMPRMGKSNKAETFDEFLQAGTDGIFVDENGNAVYYSQYLDDTYVKFMEDNDLTNPDSARAFEATTSFPIGSLELKASWKIVEDGEDTDKFFTMKSSVYGLANKGGKIVIDTSDIRQVTLALVGFHIGGVVKGHPEMIWATFEQVENAPNVPAGFTPSTVISEDDYTFYKAGTPFSGCNINYGKSPELKLDEATQKLSPITQACRQYEFGNSAVNDPKLQKSVETNDLNVSDMNKAVMPRLAQEDDVWANYREVGAIWFRPTNALKPGMTLATDFDAEGNQLLIGSLKLSNATIETFTQVQSTMNNCFRCHNTEQVFPPSADLMPLPAKNINISHAFQNIYFWSQQMKNGDELLPAKD